MEGKYSTKARAEAAILAAAAIVGLLAGPAFLASCLRRPPQGPAPALGPASPTSPPAAILSGVRSDKPTPAADGPAEPPLAMRPADTGSPLPPSGSAAAPGALPSSMRPAAPTEAILPPALVAERAFGLLAPSEALMPEDSLIGSLQDSRSGKAGEAAAYGAAKTFLDGLREGRLAEAVVEAGSLPLMKTLASPLLALGPPRSWRLGSLLSAESGQGLTASAKIRLTWAAGPSTGAMPDAKDPKGAENGPKWRDRIGEIGLREKDGVWYIESIDLGEEVLASTSGR